MPASTPSARRQPPSLRFRKEIEGAEADGSDRVDMVLRLTLNDVNALRRDATLALSDLSFSGGVMRYLGVKVEQGGVPESTLDLGQ